MAASKPSSSGIIRARAALRSSRSSGSSLLAAETLLRADAGGVPSGWLQIAVLKESAVLLDVKAAKDGKRSQVE